MRREGSPWQGLGTVFLKELSDHLTSARMLVLELLVMAVPLAALYGASMGLTEVAEGIAVVAQVTDPFLFLRLFTTAREPLLSFLTFLGFLVPLMAIGLAFDSINGEHSRRTLSRILAQPIYRDALLFGKFLGALATLAISLTALWLLVIGMGMLLLGIAPSVEEIVRSLLFLMVTIAFAAVWLALALLFSIVFRSAATAALVTLGLWLFLSVIWPPLAKMVATIVAPPDALYTSLGLQSPQTFLWEQALLRISPSVLYAESASVVLDPSARILGLVEPSQLQGLVRGAPLPIEESLVMIWPQIIGLVAGTIVLFVIGYIVFQRQEVRA